MAVITYNGVQLPMADHTDFSQEAVGDDMGDTDRCYTKFDITVQSIINASYLLAINPALLNNNAPPDSTNPADIMNSVQQLLLQRRRQLSVLVNGVEQIPQPQLGNSGVVDAKNGPIPLYCKINELGNTSYLITYRITAHYWVSPDPNASGFPVNNVVGNDVLYNRWSETTDYDTEKFCTRRRDGKFIIRSDNADGLTAGELIDKMAVVAVPPGFIRKTSKYTIMPNGLGIQYSVIDIEQFKMPPPPAFEADGDYTWDSTFKNPWGWATARVRLKGSKTTDQADLLKAAARIVTAKLRCPGSVWIQSTPPSGRFVIGLMEDFHINVDMYRNIVECSARARLIPDQRRLFGVIGTQEVNMATFTPESGPGAPPYEPDYKIRGSAIRLLRAAAYYDPSITTTVLDSVNSQLTAGLIPGQAGKTPEN